MNHEKNLTFSSCQEAPTLLLTSTLFVVCNKIFTQVMLPTNFTRVMLLRFGTFAYQIANAAELSCGENIARKNIPSNYYSSSTSLLYPHFVYSNLKKTEQEEILTRMSASSMSWPPST